MDNPSRHPTPAEGVKPETVCPKAFSYEHWPQYKSHKVVQAARIVRIDERHAHEIPGENGIVVVPPKITIWVCPTDTAATLNPGPVEQFTPTHLSMEKEARVGGWAVVYDNNFRSISPRSEFENGYDLYVPPSDEAEETKNPEPIPLESLVPLLRSPDNLGGWPLERLLKQIRAELEAKNDILKGQRSSLARGVMVTNKAIIELLARAETQQRKMLATLEVYTDHAPPGPPG